MAGIPQNFTAISNVLANYNFVDIASGTGYVNFYAGSTVDLYLLSNNTFYSNVIREQILVTDSNFVLIGDRDFDILLNRPIDIKGIGIVNIPVGIDGNAYAGEIYAVVYVRKVSGGVETDIVTNTSSSFAGTNEYKMLAVDVDCPLTHFKKGDTLRLTVMYYAKKTGGSNPYAVFAYDPKSRTVTWDTTGGTSSQLIFQCPVRLNL